MNKELGIPHINTLMWQGHGDKINIEKADNDKTTREFGIRFFLEDLRARTQYVHVSLSEELSQHAGEGEDAVNMWFEKNSQGFLESILIQLNSSNYKYAFKTAYNNVINILSMFVFFYRRPFRINAIRIYDNKYNTSYGTFAYCPQKKMLILPKASFSKEVPIGSLLALYREGMNSIDLAYRYINFFKIYEAWYKNDFAFKLTDNALKRKGIKRPHFSITKELLLGSYVALYHEGFLNKPFKDRKIFKKLNHLRNLLAHYLLTQVEKPCFMNFDNLETQEYIEAMTNLLERMVTKILDTEFSLLAQSDNDFKKIYEIYSKVI